jgi:signal transduction histidine kinase
MSEEMIGIFVVLFSVTTILGFILFVVYIVSLHQRNRARFIFETEELKNNFNSEILKTELEMQEHTFEKISMEIHDNVGQILTVSKLNLEMIASGSPDIQEKVKYSVDLMNHAIADLRNLSRRLDADTIRQDGLSKAISEYVRHLRKSIVADIIFRDNGQSRFLTLEKELVLFRILQEALNNIIRHANASTIEIVLTTLSSELQMNIRDNGKGFDLAALYTNLPGGSGIKNMQKRTRLMNGIFSLETDIGMGTRINIRLPFGS